MIDGIARASAVARACASFGGTTVDAFAFARGTGARAFVSADAMSTSSTLRARVRALVRLVHPDVLMLSLIHI